MLLPLLIFRQIRFFDPGFWYKFIYITTKQCWSRSVGFWRSHLIWIYIVCKVRAYQGSAGPALMHQTGNIFETHYKIMFYKIANKCEKGLQCMNTCLCYYSIITALDKTIYWYFSDFSTKSCVVVFIGIKSFCWFHGVPIRYVFKEK